MCTVTLSYDKTNEQARQQLAALFATGLFTQLYSYNEDESPRNRVYIDNGEVKTDVVTETMSIDEAKRLTLEVVELEHSLP